MNDFESWYNNEKIRQATLETGEKISESNRQIAEQLQRANELKANESQSKTSSTPILTEKQRKKLYKILLTLFVSFAIVSFLLFAVCTSLGLSIGIFNLILKIICAVSIISIISIFLIKRVKKYGFLSIWFVPIIIINIIISIIVIYFKNK